MLKIEQLNLAEAHHAQMVLGADVLAAEFARGADPRISFFHWPNLGINEARILRGEASRTAAERRFVVVATGALTEEAQNALLKTVEEPARNTVFVFLVPRQINLLPTLRSRLHILEWQGGQEQEKEREGVLANFVQAPPEKRLDFVAQLIKKAGDNSKSEALKFLTDLEIFLSRKVDWGKVNQSLISTLAEIRRGREYLADKSGTPKLILEHIAILL